ncbi:MAG TPA: hypothetical protein VGP97_26675 [Burkholderiales bacterium]|nr:hypothetical protein [Burkholderiales bacterium]
MLVTHGFTILALTRIPVNTGEIMVLTSRATAVSPSRAVRGSPEPMRVSRLIHKRLLSAINGRSKYAEELPQSRH